MEEATKVSSRFQNDELITIELEESTKTFKIQAALLCGASLYFGKALTGNFKESTDKVLRLPGCDESTFEIFLYWLCKRHLPKMDINEDDPEEWEVSMVRLYALADLCLVPELQNQVMVDLLADLSCGTLHDQAVRYAFEHLGEDSLVRAVIVEQAVSDYMEEYMDKDTLELLASVPGFTTAFVRLLWENRHSDGVLRSPSAAYYKGSTEACMVPSR